MTHRTTDTWFAADFFAVPVIAVLRGLDSRAAVRAAERAWDAGVHHVEVTIESPAAVAALAAVAAAAAERGLAVGAGTVVTVEQLAVAEQVQASFTVSPGLDARIVQASVERGVPHLPGVSTASELMQAHSMGLSWVKVFPASLLGPDWVRAMKGPFPHMHFIATGGMRATAAADYLGAGVGAVGLSSDFTTDGGSAAVREMLARLVEGRVERLTD